MLSRTTPLIVLATALGSLAATPSGFQPSAKTDLLVTFGSASASNGNVLAKDSTQTAPTIGTASKLTGTSFAVIMVDLDIPTDTPPLTSTLLHWMQVGLTQAQTATKFNSTSGSTSAFVLSAPATQAAFQAYAGPAPPARIPLSHRYTQILIDTSAATEANLASLQQSAATRRGFNALTVLEQAGLADKVLAGNFFNVTNAGPVTSTNATASAGATGTGSSGTGTIKPTSTPTNIQPGAAGIQAVNGLLLGVGVLGAGYLGL